MHKADKYYRIKRRNKMKSNKLTSLILGIIVAMSMLSVPAFAETTVVQVNGEDVTTISPMGYIEGTEWVDKGTFVTVANDKTTEEEYILSIPLEVTTAGDYQMVFESAQKLDNAALSPVKFKLDDGDAVRIEDNGTTIASTTDKNTGWGIYLSKKKYKEKLSLSEGSHTISFIVNEQRLFRGSPKGYYAAIGDISISPAEQDGIRIRSGEENVIKPYEYLDNSNWVSGTGYAKVQAGGATEPSAYTLTLDLYVPESDAFTMKLEAALNPSGSNYHMSRMKFKLDDGEFIMINNTTFSDLGNSGKSSWGEALKLRQYGERLILNKGQHKLTFVVDELRTVDGVQSGQYAALGDITLSPITFIGGLGDKSSLGFESGCTYTSSNPEIAEVSTSGEISLKRSGTATVTITDNSGNVYNSIVYVTRESGLYISKAYVDGSEVYFEVKGDTDAISYEVFLGKRKKSEDGTLYGFAQTVRTSGGYAQFDSISGDEEIVIFLVDAEDNHLYGKTVLTAE